jgi:hypothetical protein
LQGNVVEKWANLVAPLNKIKSKLCIIHSFGEEKAKYMRTVTQNGAYKDIEMHKIV